MPSLTLQQAASQGNVEQLNLHIARGTDLNQADRNNMTALARAAMGGHLEAVKALVAGGADVNGASFMGPPLVVAVSRMQPEIVEYLVGAGADVNGKGRGGQTGLIAAASIGQQEIVVKALDELIRSSVGIAGATILGDGKVVLIVDVTALVEKYKLQGGRIKGNEVENA